jgi:hypothetical protein
MTSIYIKEGTELPERHSNDDYITERTLIYRALHEFLPARRVYGILDVGAGDGRWGSIAREITHANVVVGVELQEMPAPDDFTDWFSGQDFLTWKTNYTFDLIVSNPPYSIAEECIRKSWDLLEAGGTMIMLLRLAFQASIRRYNGLWVEIHPHTVAVCSRRPSFYGGGTNGDEYGIYIWKKDRWGMPVGNPRQWNTKLFIYPRDKT